MVTVLLGSTLLLTFWAADMPPHRLRLAAAGVAAAMVGGIVTVAIGDHTAEGIGRLTNAALVALAPPALVLGMLRSVRRHRAVTIEAVLGGLALYVLVGMFFAFVFGAVDNLGGEPFFAQGVAATPQRCSYFSFSTLTTVGFGDLTARGDLGRTLAVLEALIGQLYLVTVVSVGVSNLAPRVRPGEASVSAFARRRSFWNITGWAGVFGLVMGAVGIAWLGLVEKLPQELWGHPADHDFAGGTWWWIPLATGFGLLVGLMRRWLTAARQPDLFAEINEAHVDHKVVPPSVAVSAVSLMGGASLGPEGGLGLLGGGLGDWFAKRTKADPETRKAHTLTGMAGAFGGLFTAPLLGPLMIAEVARPGGDRPVERLIPTVLASTLGFAVLYPVVGYTFLDLYEVPSYDLEVWHLFAAVGIGAMGAVVAVLPASRSSWARASRARRPRTPCRWPWQEGSSSG